MAKKRNDSGISSSEALLMPRTNAERIWLLPSTEAKSTVLACRMILVVIISVFLATPSPQTKNQPMTTSEQETYWWTLAALALLTLLVFCILVGCQGPRWSLLYRIGGVGRAPQLFYRKTLVKPGYEPVAEAFADTLAEGRETGMQFCVYVKGELVVDLAGSTVDNPDNILMDNDNHQMIFDSDTYSTVWSSSKVITSILVAWLVDQGYLDYQAKIKDYWPEFTGGGKEDVSLEQLMKHHAGLTRPPPFAMRMEDVFPENLSSGKASKIFEGMTCRYPPKWTKWMAYHSITRGWILNEIARRVDPQKRTLGVILREEFTEPLKIDSECYLGLPEHLCEPETNPKLRAMDPVPYYFWVICNKLCQLLRIPTTVQWKFFLGHTAIVTYVALHWASSLVFYNPKFLAMHKLTLQAAFRRGESPSANIQSSARALATIANAMATGDTRIFQSGQDILETAAQNEETRHLMPMGPSKNGIMPMSKVTFNDGGFCVLVPPLENDDADKSDGVVKTHIPSLPGFQYAWGWFGFNGSLLAFHPNGDFAVAFQPTAFNDLNPIARVEKMTKALRECGRQLHGDDWSKYEDTRVPKY